MIFAVSDTGVGIAPEYIGRIFEEFEQADGSMRRRHGGAGLGLAISRRFVALHKGRMWVESQVGWGSTFYFSLPVERSDLIATSAHLASEEVTGGPLAPQRGEEPVLLVVTRSPAAAALLTRYVRGFRTAVFPGLKQAQETAQ